MRLGLGLGLPYGGKAAFHPSMLDPLAWWRLEDGSGAAAVDSSGNGYDLTLANTPTWIAGHIGGALRFAAASSEKGETAAAGLRTALQGLSAFSVAFWARAAAYQSEAGAFAIRNGTDTGALLLIYPYDSGGGGSTQVFYSGEAVITGGAAAPLDQWNHFIFVSRSSTDHELYVNDASAGTGAAPKSLPATISHVTVGAWNGGQFFNGDLDEVMIFNRALTALERTALYEWTG